MTDAISPHFFHVWSLQYQYQFLTPVFNAGTPNPQHTEVTPTIFTYVVHWQGTIKGNTRLRCNMQRFCHVKYTGFETTTLIPSHIHFHIGREIMKEFSCTLK
jgi:hypothetical protein